MCGFSGGGGVAAATNVLTTGLSALQGGGSSGVSPSERLRAEEERRRLSLQNQIAAAEAEEARQLAAAEASRIRRDGQEAVARQRSLQARAGGVVGSDSNLLLNDDLAERFELDALAREQGAPSVAAGSGGGGGASTGGSSAGGGGSDPFALFRA